MGFFDEAEKQKQMQSTQDSNYGKTQGQILSEHPFEVMILVALVLLAVSLIVVVALRSFKSFHKVDKPINQLLEKRKSWRISKLCFWLALGTIVVVCFATARSYGALTVVFSYPLYLIFRRIYMYINDVKIV